ncbi:MAG: hypothetical protein ILP10_07120, partial [Lachnospiraceae bacterium]|nr:hypothetical protein [Lachnospiraceae bacterium]
MNEKSRQIALIFVATLLFQEVAKLTGIISAIPSPVLRLVASQFVLAAPAFVYLTVKTVGGRDSFPRVYADTVGMRRTRPASL